MGYLELDSDYQGEPQELREEVHRFVKDEIRPLALEIDRMDSDEYQRIGERPSPFWEIIQKIRGHGYHRMGFPEEYGGIEITPEEEHIIKEEFAWGDLSTYPTHGSHVASFAVASGDEDLIERFTIPYLEDERGDEMFSCWGVTEPENGSNHIGHGTKQIQREDTESKPQVTMEKDGDEYIINGQKASWVSGAPVATHVALHVDMDPKGGEPGGTLVVVPLDNSGVTRGKPLQKIGTRTYPQAELVFNDVRIPEENVLRTRETLHPGSGPLSYPQHFCSTSAAVAATSTGVARAAFEEALSYARTREQGGRPICEHQTVKKKLYSMFEKVETSREYSRKITKHLHDDSFTEKSYRHSLAAQVYCSERAFEVAHQAVQIHGGNGITQDYLVEKLFRDARTFLVADGTSDVLSLEAADDIISNYDIS
jgi:alkylation response protein AidB-like acyl-CoA dehydrogenase